MATAGTSTPAPPRGLRALAPLGPPVEAGPPRPWRLLVLGCLALAVLSLLGPSQPTYDPWAWLIWGRDIVEGDLVTQSGPSWKPLPVLFTTVFALAGDEAAALLWLVVARAGGLLALAMAFRLAARLAGPIAGVVAAVSLAAADHFASFAIRGNSEGMLVALALWAVERHLDGRGRDAFLLGVGCALLRPEVWPFLALYALWLVATAGPERRRRTAVLAGGSGVAVALLWFVPEYIGSGDFLRAASRALEPVPDSPAQAAHPFLAVFENSAVALWPPAYAGGVVAVLLALGGRMPARPRAVVLALAVVSTVLMVEVAVLAEIGFTGNLRYVALPASLVCVLAGVGWARLLGLVRERAGGRTALATGGVLLVAAAPFAVITASSLADQLRQLRDETARAADLPDAIAEAGGVDAVLRCGTVKTGPFETQLVAWHLHLHQREVGLFPTPPATLVAVRGSRLAQEPGFATLAGSEHWTIRSSCGG
jgi:hypothetical protein